MINNGGGQTLRVDDAGRIDALRADFETAWKRKASPHIEEFLNQVPEVLRSAAFGELLKVDIHYRRAQGQELVEQDYVARFPRHEAAILEACRDTFNDAATITRAPRGASSGLQVRCPYCRNSIALAPDSELGSVCCETCGANFSLTSDEDGATRDARGVAQVGHFKLVERLGMGAFGAVWKAQDQELDRTVAIKLPRAGQLDKQQQEHFLREARSAAQLRHPNIVPVYEVGRDGETLYIVSEFVRGITLSDRLTGGALGATEAAELGATIADALHHAHEQGVIHRDLKPANVMIDGAGEPHLMDFGLARRVAHEVTMTAAGQLLGTPAYMSPEQAQGESHAADRRSDVYSLGVILFELLTGELPFRGNARMMIHQVLNDEPPSPRKLNASVPRDLETITLKCLQKEPGRRYQSADEVAGELRRFVRGEPIVSRPVGPLERRWRWCRRNPVVASLIATAVSLLAGVAIVATVGYAETSRALRQKAEAAATSEQVSAFLMNLFRSSNPLQFDEGQNALSPRDPQDANLTARELLDRGANRIRTDLVDQPRVQATLLTTIGNAYHGLGLYKSAREAFQEALDIEQKINPDDAEAIAGTKHRLGLAVHYSGDFTGAEPLYVDALRLYTAAYGERSMQATVAMQSLGILYTQQERFNEANTLLTRAVAIREELRGPNDDSVGFSLAHLAAYQLAADQDDDAKETIARVVHIAAINRSGEMKQTAEVIGDYQSGVRAMELGEYDQAVIALKRAVDAMKETVGERHPFVAFVLYDYGRALEGIGDHKQAIQTIEDAMALGSAVVGDRHPLMLQARLNVAAAYFNDGERERAEELLVPLMADAKAFWGEDSPQYADHLAATAFVLRANNQVDRAHDLANAALTIFEGSTEPALKRHWHDRIYILLELADGLLQDARLDLAQRAVEQGARIAAAVGERTGWSEQYAVRRARVRALQGRADEAEAVLRDVYVTLRRRFGVDDWRTREAAEAMKEHDVELPVEAEAAE